MYKINVLSIKVPCVLQENDYMSLLFHLYDSDNEDDGEGDGNEDRPDTLQMALIRYLLTRKFMNYNLGQNKREIYTPLSTPPPQVRDGKMAHFGFCVTFHP